VIGEAENDYKIEVVVPNPTGQDLLARRIGILANEPPNPVRLSVESRLPQLHSSAVAMTLDLRSVACTDAISAVHQS
jgi:hypothetical protein